MSNGKLHLIPPFVSEDYRVAAVRAAMRRGHLSMFRIAVADACYGRLARKARAPARMPRGTARTGHAAIHADGFRRLFRQLGEQKFGFTC